VNNKNPNNDSNKKPLVESYLTKPLLRDGFKIIEKKEKN
jgi:hypothetical protein